MLVPLCCCTLINVHFDVFFNVCGFFRFVSVSVRRAGRAVSSRQYCWFWHQCINRGCNKIKSKKTPFSPFPYAPETPQYCNMTVTLYAKKLPKASNTITGNIINPDNFTNKMCPVVTSFREFLKNIVLADYMVSAKKELKFNGGPVHPNMRSHSQRSSHVTVARVCAYAFFILTTGAASAGQDVPGCCGNPLGLSLLLPDAAANKQTYKRMYWPDNDTQESTVFI